MRYYSYNNHLELDNILLNAQIPFEKTKDNKTPTNRTCYLIDLSPNELISKLPDGYNGEIPVLSPADGFLMKQSTDAMLTSGACFYQIEPEYERTKAQQLLKQSLL